MFPLSSDHVQFPSVGIMTLKKKKKIAENGGMVQHPWK